MASRKLTVLVTGVFDILHREHLNFLRLAKAQGEKLLVGIESDIRVKQIKGFDRPVNSQQVRKAKLDDLGLADEVFILPEQFSQPEDHERLIARLRPDILAVYSHTPNLYKKRQLLKRYGGRVVEVLKQNPNVSTTLILEQAMSKR